MRKMNTDTLCSIRDLYLCIMRYESRFEELFGLSLNEGMLLCTLSRSDGSMTCGELAARLDLSSSNMSKVIKSAERKGLLARRLGEQDRRQMYFALSERGREQLEAIDMRRLDIPEPLLRLCHSR